MEFFNGTSVELPSEEIQNRRKNPLSVILERSGEDGSALNVTQEKQRDTTMNSGWNQGSLSSYQARPEVDISDSEFCSSFQGARMLAEDEAERLLFANSNTESFFDKVDGDNSMSQQNGTNQQSEVSIGTYFHRRSSNPMKDKNIDSNLSQLQKTFDQTGWSETSGYHQLEPRNSSTPKPSSSGKENEKSTCKAPDVSLTSLVTVSERKLSTISHVLEESNGSISSMANFFREQDGATMGKEDLLAHVLQFCRAKSTVDLNISNMTNTSFDVIKYADFKKNLEPDSDNSASSKNTSCSQESPNTTIVDKPTSPLPRLPSIRRNEPSIKEKKNKTEVNKTGVQGLPVSSTATRSSGRSKSAEKIRKIETAVQVQELSSEASKKMRTNGTGIERLSYTSTRSSVGSESLRTVRSSGTDAPGNYSLLPHSSTAPAENVKAEKCKSVRVDNTIRNIDQPQDQFPAVPGGFPYIIQIQYHCYGGGNQNCGCRAASTNVCSTSSKNISNQQQPHSASAAWSVSSALEGLQFAKEHLQKNPLLSNPIEKYVAERPDECPPKPIKDNPQCLEQSSEIPQIKFNKFLVEFRSTPIGVSRVDEFTMCNTSDYDVSFKCGVRKSADQCFGNYFKDQIPDCKHEVLIILKGHEVKSIPIVFRPNKPGHVLESYIIKFSRAGEVDSRRYRAEIQLSGIGVELNPKGGGRSK